MRPARFVSVLACVAVALGLPGFVGTASAAPPSNDTIGGATAVASLPYTATVDTSAATTDSTDTQANSTCGAPATNNSVWYTFTAGAGDTTLAVDTTGSNYSTGVLIATGTPGALITRACSPVSSRVATTAGTTYYVMLFADVGTGGSLHLSMHGPGPVPPNDKIGKAIGIAPLPFKATVDTSGATTDFVDTQANKTCGAPAISNTVWYKFTPGLKHNLSFDTFDSDFEAGVLVATANEGTLTTVACGPEEITATLKPHTTYYIAIFDPFGEGGGTLRLNVSDAPTMTVHVRKFARVDANGYVRLRGTFSCTRVRSVSLLGQVVEIVGDKVVTGQVSIRIPNAKCNNGQQSWHGTVVPLSLKQRFAPGKAAVSINGFACGNISCVSAVSTSVVQLAGKVASSAAVAPVVRHSTKLTPAGARRYGKTMHRARTWRGR